MSGNILTANGQNAMANLNSDKLIQYWENKTFSPDIKLEHIPPGNLAQAELKILGKTFKQTFNPITIRNRDELILTWSLPAKSFETINQR